MPRESGALLFGDLVYLLFRIDAPQARLLDPAVEPLAREPAPAALALLHGPEHAMLQLRGGSARGIGLGPEREKFVLALELRRNQRGALAGQQRVITPAFGSFPVADATPVLELGRDLH